MVRRHHPEPVEGKSENRGSQIFPTGEKSRMVLAFTISLGLMTNLSQVVAQATTPADRPAGRGVGIRR